MTVALPAGVRKSPRPPKAPVGKSATRRERCLTGRGTLTIVRAARLQPVEARDGAVAQLGERRVRNAKVRGSIPLGSTKLASSDQVPTVFSVPAAAIDRAKAVRMAPASASRR